MNEGGAFHFNFYNLAMGHIFHCVVNKKIIIHFFPTDYIKCIPFLTILQGGWGILCGPWNSTVKLFIFLEFKELKKLNFIQNRVSFENLYHETHTFFSKTKTVIICKLKPSGTYGTVFCHHQNLRISYGKES